MDWNFQRLEAAYFYYSHTLRGCVDWNPFKGILWRTQRMSHPAWVCGLKQGWKGSGRWKMGSHPAWVCGLKQFERVPCVSLSQSHPAWVCGLKHKLSSIFAFVIVVTPCVGVWIETLSERKDKFRSGHTLRGCVDWNSMTKGTGGTIIRHTLRGCVDWNKSTAISRQPKRSHTLRGCVDWNR